MQTNYRRRRGSHVWAGLFVLLIGALLLAKQSGSLFFPDWLFSWPMILIAIGLFLGLRHGFRNAAWLFPVFIGSVFLIDDIFPDARFRNYIAPVIVMGIGLLILFRPRSRGCYRNRLPGENRATAEEFPGQPAAEPGTDTSYSRADYLDATSVFGGVKKNILSKNFRGGEIVNFMGGSEINLTQADFNGVIRIDTTNIFGGTKLMVPANWDVQSEVVAIFGGVDDKRHLNGHAIDPKKVLIIEGTCLFGGIDIRSF